MEQEIESLIANAEGHWDKSDDETMELTNAFIKALKGLDRDDLHTLRDILTEYTKTKP